MGGHQATLRPILLKDGKLAVLFLHLLDSVVIFLPKLLVLVRLDTQGSRLDVVVVRALRRRGVVHRYQFLSLVIVFNFFADIHSLVVCFNAIIVAECRVDLLLDDAAHTVGEVV